jgi:hypothetical protein
VDVADATPQVVSDASWLLSWPGVKGQQLARGCRCSSLYPVEPSDQTCTQHINEFNNVVHQRCIQTLASSSAVEQVQVSSNMGATLAEP